MILRRTILSLLLLGLCLPSARAEVKLLLKMEHAAFIEFESVNAFLKIFNDDGRPFELGSGSNGTAELTFQVGRKRDEWHPKGAPGPLLKDLVLEPGESRDVVIDLSRWYDVSSPGRYFVRAVLRRGKSYFYSPDAIVDVVHGIEVAKAVREVTGYSDVLRTYSLRFWRREQFDYLFLSVVETPGDTNKGVFQLGKLLRVEPPRIDVDRDGNVMVLHQTARDCFIRTLFKSDGEGVQFVDQQYELPSGEPYPETRSRPGGALPDAGRKP